MTAQPGTATASRETPGSAREVAELLRASAEEGRSVRAVGGGTKLGWGTPSASGVTELSTRGLDAVVEHNAGDFTAVLEAGVPLARAQEAFAEAGQMLALDPPLGEGAAATVGGVLATGDSGPLRHRYLAPRDLVLGATVAHADGTVARSGSKVIKNVAGYDLAKLMAGSFGTLGVIVQVAVRLHPRPRRTVTATATSDDPGLLVRGASALSHAQLEMESLDLAWNEGRGRVMARFGGAAAGEQAAAARRIAETAGLEGALVEDDERLWSRQRSAQRSADGIVLRVSATQRRLAAVLRAAERERAWVVARAAAAICFLRLPPQDPARAAGAVKALREELAPSPCVVLDAPAEVRRLVDPWGAGGPEVELMRRVKARFDPSGTCNRGIFVGGI